MSHRGLISNKVADWTTWGMHCLSIIQRRRVTHNSSISGPSWNQLTTTESAEHHIKKRRRGQPSFKYEPRQSTKGARKRELSQDRKTTALTSGPNQTDYAKVAKQVRERSFRFDGAEKPFEFLKQGEWSAQTYGLDLEGKEGLWSGSLPTLSNGEPGLTS